MIREATIEDLDALNDLGLILRSDYARIFNIEEILNQDYAHIYVYCIDDKIVGFLHVEEHFEIMDIINIVVSPEYRRKGIATALFNYALGDTAALKVMLEVKNTNDEALKLYQNWGFVTINIRKNYYESADALIMERKIR